MDFDDLLKNYIGEIGMYQILLLLFGCSITTNIAFNAIDYIFTGATPKFRCDFGEVPEELQNFTFDELQLLTSPKIGNGGGVDACRLNDYNYSSLSAYEAIGVMNNVSVSSQKCERWVYSQEQFTETLVSQWDLVCDRKWLLTTSQSVYMAGQFTICIGGFLINRFGRRAIALTCMCLNIAIRCLIAFSPNIYVFLLARFLQSSVAITLYVSYFLLALESVGPRWRVFAGQAPYVFWSVGYMMLSGMAYLFRDWSQLTLVLTVFSLPYLLHFCFLKESARWYNSKNRTAEALEVVQTMAKVNHRKIPEKVLKQLSEDQIQEEEKLPIARITDLLKSWSVIRLTLYQCVIWFCTVCVYYGLIFYLPELGGNLFISTLISAALELPALVYVQLTLNTWLGRRLNCFITLSLTGAVLLALIWIPKEYTWLSLSLALAGRFANAATFSIIYIHTSEIYPTVLRSVGLSVCSFVCRLGTVVAPQLAVLGIYVDYLPPLMFGVISLVGAVLSLLLPETRGKVLQDKVTDIHLISSSHEKKKRSTEDTSVVNTYM